MKPMTIDPLMDLEVQNLSGGELQRVALALCLGQPADIYLIDEPSAYLDSEQRIMASKVGTADGWTSTVSTGCQPLLQERADDWLP
jgi:translation initiation factor RLI1